MPIALVAVKQYFPKSVRIIDDGLAARLLPAGARILVRMLEPRSTRNWVIAQSEKSNPGICGGLLSRKRYIDEKLIASRNEIEALVSLGAGFDTGSYRLTPLSALPVWEIDQRENVETKQKRLCKALGTIPRNVRLVPADFDRNHLGTILAEQGYSADKPTFFVWEAVSQYLSEPGVRATFEWIAKARPMSRLAFTYVRRDFMDGRNLYDWESGYRRFVRSKLWRFGMMPGRLPRFPQQLCLPDVGYDELADRYIRPTGRRLASTPVERMAYAERV